MKKMTFLIISLLLIFLNILFYSYRYTVFSENVKKFDEYMQNKLISEYGTIIKDFSNLSNFIFDAYIGINSLSFSYFYEGSYLGKDSDMFRKKLHDHLLPIFEKAKGIGFSQIHFHTDNGYSYLRMHKPESYGDKLYDIRPMIKKVIETQKKIEGFEVGVNEVAYRTIYPLKYRGNYVGSVEIAINSDYLLNYMNRELANYYCILIDKKVASIMSKDTVKKRYDTDIINNFYVGKEYKFLDPDRLDVINKLAKATISSQKKSKGSVIHLKDTNIVILPIKDYSGRFIGYIVKEDRNNYYASQKIHLIIEISIITIFSFVLLVGLAVIFRKNRQLNDEINNGKKINIELERVNKLFKLVLENSGQIVYDYNMNTGVVIRSGSIEDILGIPKNKFEKTYVTDFVARLHPDDKNVAMEFITGNYGEGKRFSCSYRLKNENGEYIHIQDQGLYVTIDGERHIVGTMKDVSSVVKYEQTIQKNQRLESLSILAGGIAHDFNNILSGIWTYIEMIRLVNDPKIVDDCINRAQSAFLRAKALISQLLTFTKSGDPEIGVVNVKKLVKSVAEFASAGSSVKLHFNIKENTKNCLGDEHQLAQVIENIVINARQAMSDKGNIYIDVSNYELFDSRDLEHGIAPGEYVKISIEDEGPGISQEQTKKIFEPFYTTKSKGKGIGLAVSYNIIKKHKGTIKVESEVGKFTRFDIYLPATDDIEAKQLEKNYETVDSYLTIALMDDEFFILDSSKILLETLGHRVIIAKNGEELLDLYRKIRKEGRDIDLFILDVTIIGGMGGIETVQELKKINPEIKAIVSSGYSDDPVFTKYKEYGFSASLKKPYSMAEMSDAIKSAMGKG